MIETRIIPIEKIVANPYQPRTTFNDEKILELAHSIKENGLIQPILVRQIGEQFEIIAGERRYRAMISIGYTDVPVVLSNANDSKSATLALIENIQREDLNVVEEAIALKEILKTQNLTQKELALQIGKSQSSIANKIRLLDLPENVLGALATKTITERHARAMVGIEKEQTDIILDKVIKQKLNVKQTETLVDKPKKRKPVTKGYSQNIQIGINTIKQAVTMVEKLGMSIDQDIDETDDEVIVTIKFKK